MGTPSNNRNIMGIEKYQQQRTNMLQIATRKQSIPSPDEDWQYCSRNVAINRKSDSIMRQTNKVHHCFLHFCIVWFILFPSFQMCMSQEMKNIKNLLTSTSSGLYKKIKGYVGPSHTQNIPLGYSYTHWNICVTRSIN